MDFLFGADMPLAVRFFFAFVIVLALIGLTAFLVRRFGGERLGASSSRGRQPRLAVIDAAAVDGRRRLILIRRDNVEHLLMIGGPSDVVVEANIVRAGAPAREGAPQRPPEALPRAVQNENNMWPLQPEPAPAPPPARAPRQQPMMEDPPPWQTEPEAPPLPPRREARPEPRMEMRPEPRAEMRPEPRDMRPEPRPEVRPEPRPATADPLAGLAAELSRAQPEAPAPKPRPIREREAPVREREAPAPREREPMRARAPQVERVRPAPPPMEEPTPASADQNLAEMAQRLEAALRRPKAPESRGAEPAAPKPAMMAPPPSEPMIPMMADPTPMSSAPEPSAPHDDAPAAAPQPQRAAAAKPGKSVYDSLEQEMASLLGRPNSKA
jgi:flagellar protein FliO/FliZ